MLMSLGGVLGGLFVSILAPLMFNSMVEYSLLMILGIAARQDLWDNAKLRSFATRPVVPLAAFAILLGILTLIGGDGTVPHAKPAELAVFATLALVLFLAKERHLALVAIAMMPLTDHMAQPDKRVSLRSYFGIMSVADVQDNGHRFLMHGTTIHGAERLIQADPAYTGKPTPLTYYSEAGGMARVLMATQENVTGGTYGIVGLGTGSLACYKKPGENWAFYEIDPDVIRVARDPAQFTFLSSCGPDIPIVEGDARLTLKKRTGPSFDYLLIDAFSSDSIPVHLLTVEALQSYLAQLNPDGTLAIHVTNRFMDLVPYVLATAAAADPSLKNRLVYLSPAKPDITNAHSMVLVLSRDSKILERLDKGGSSKPLETEAGLAPWTDDFANVPAAIWRRLSAAR
jgi:hypothetical protein